MGIGDWGLGIGDWGLGIGMNPGATMTNAQATNHKPPKNKKTTK